MKVLVTGGTGFIGANLVRHLLDRGDAVRCLVRQPPARRSMDVLEGLDVDLIQTPLEDSPDGVDALARALDGCEGVYHLAGVFDSSPGGIDRMNQVHVLATRALLQASAKAGVRRLVLCSSSVTVGFGPIDAPGDEDTAGSPDAIYGPKGRGPGGALRGYHDTKLRAEQMVMGWPDVQGVVVNPDFILGPWDVKPTSGQLIVAMARRWIPFYPRGGKCFQGVDDCAMGHALAMDKGQPGRRYLLANENLSYREFMRIVAAVTGQRPPVLPLPDSVAAIGGMVGSLGSQVDAHLFAGLDPWVLRSMQQQRYRTAERSFRELGVPRTPVSDAVESAYAWFRDHGYMG